MPKHKKSKLKRIRFRDHKYSWSVALIVVVLVAGIGVYYLLSGHAAVSPSYLGGTTNVNDLTAYPATFPSPSPTTIPSSNSHGGRTIMLNQGSSFDQTTINNAGPSALFIFGSGTWNGSRTTVNPLANDMFYGQGSGKTVLNSYVFDDNGSDPNVTIANLKITGFWSDPSNVQSSHNQVAAIESNGGGHGGPSTTGWQILNNDVSGGNSGIVAGDNSLVQNNYVHNNAQNGLGGGGSNSIIRYNAAVDNAGSTSVVSGKTVGAYDSGNKSGFDHADQYYGNYLADSGKGGWPGSGEWCDVYCTNNNYHDNVVVRNAFNGFMMEIAYQVNDPGEGLPIVKCGTPASIGAYPGDFHPEATLPGSTMYGSACGDVVDHNLVGGNGYGQGDWQGDGILISSSQGQFVTNNYVWDSNGTQNSGTDIQVYCQNRVQYRTTCSGNTVTGNHVTKAIGVGGANNTADTISNNVVTAVSALQVPKLCAGPQPEGVNLASGQCGAVLPNPPANVPSISSVTPASGLETAATPITITGTNFSAGASVTINGVAATNVTVVSSTKITATAPTSATAGAASIVVTAGGQSSSSSNGYTYVAPPQTAPTLPTITPSQGSTHGGTVITITGTNFAASTANAPTTVKLGTTLAANVKVLNATTITAVTPDATAAGTTSVTVTTAGQTATDSNAFTYVTPPTPPGPYCPTATNCQAPVLSLKTTTPTKLEAENYDEGGEGSAYHDLDTTNSGGSTYRGTDSVDVKNTPSASNTHDVGFFQQGEWLDYTISVPTAGTYAFSATDANPNDGAQIAVSLGSAAPLATVTVPNNGIASSASNAYTTFTNTAPADITLPAGTTTIRLTAAATAYIGDVDSFSLTYVPPTIALSPPTTLTTTTITNGVDLAWAAPSTTTGLVSYNIYRATTTSTTAATSFPDTPLATVPSGTTSYTDTTTSPSTHYSYEVTAVDTNNNETAPTNVATITTPTPPAQCTTTSKPTTPANFVTLATPTTTTIGLSWSPSTASTGCSLKNYRIYAASDTSLTSPLATVTGSPDGTTPPPTTTTLTSLTPNTRYALKVVAYDTANHASTPSTTLTTQTQALPVIPPNPPTTVTAVVTNTGQVSLNWIAATTSGASITGYQVYRNGSPLGSPQPATTATYTDTAVAASTTYTYQLATVDAAGLLSTKAATTPATVTTPAASTTTIPTDPTTLTAPVKSPNHIQLKWNASTTQRGQVGYHVYVDNVLYPHDTTTTSLTEACLAPGVTYTFSVQAYNTTAVTSHSSHEATLVLQTPASTPGALSGDIDCSGTVNGLDLFQVETNWGKSGILPENGEVDGTAPVNGKDLLPVEVNWGKS
jgi:fibronectin type 3 domain-containing protein